jgi:uncharacterized membrane protein YecN with MAPEG domain
MMTFPFVSTITAGFVVLLQVFLAVSVSAGRGRNKSAIGDGGKVEMLRLIRRHGNLAENGAIFVVGFTMLELSALYPKLLIVLCTTFAAVRIGHAVGLSQVTTDNSFRVVGAIGTYIIGLALGSILLWTGVRVALVQIVAG